MVDRNEYKRRQAPPGVRVLAQGVRQGPPAADHQPLARLNRSSVDEAGWQTRRPLLPELALIAATIAYGGTFKIVQDALDHVDAGRVHPVAVHRRDDRARAVRAAARLAAARRRARGSRDFWSAALGFGLVGFAGYWFQNAGLAAHHHVELRVHHRFVRGVHAARRDRGDAARAEPQRVGRGRGLGGRSVPAHRRVVQHRCRRRAHARAARSCSRSWIFLGGTLLAAVRPGRAHRRADGACSRCARCPVVLVSGIGDDHRGRSSSPRSFTGVVCSAVAFTLQLWGQRSLEPSRAAVILLFEPVVAGFVGYLVGERLGVDGLRRRARDLRRHPHRRVARWRWRRLGARPSSPDRLLDRAVKGR